MLLAGPISHTSTRCMDFVEIFNIILDLSITCFSRFSGCCSCRLWHGSRVVILKIEKSQ